jgi:hypothetical protein
MLCEELANHRLFVELEDSIDQQVVPDRSIVCCEWQIGVDTEAPEETGALDDIYELAQSAGDHSVLIFTKRPLPTAVIRVLFCKPMRLDFGIDHKSIGFP